MARTFHLWVNQFCRKQRLNCLWKFSQDHAVSEYGWLFSKTRPAFDGNVTDNGRIFEQESDIFITTMISLPRQGRISSSISQGRKSFNESIHLSLQQRCMHWARTARSWHPLNPENIWSAWRGNLVKYATHNKIKQWRVTNFTVETRSKLRLLRHSSVISGLKLKI